MKPVATMLVLGFCLSSLSYVYTIKCIECDPDSMDDCKEIPLNCDEDDEFGHTFDSCFTYVMVIKQQGGGNYTYKVKNCGIKDGCKLLEQQMCHNANKTLNNAVQSCDMQCCEGHDYCNAATKTTAGGEVHSEPLSPTTESTVNANVLGYKAGAATRVTTWILHVPMALIVLYFSFN